jgi:hypothetical protein
MKGWGLLAKAWHDSVGSKVIAGVILAVLGSIWLWAESGWSKSLTVVWASARALFALPTTISLGVALLTLAAFGAIFVWLVSQLLPLRAINMQLRSRLTAAVRAVEELQAERRAVATEWERHREDARLVLAIGLKEQAVMHVLAGIYPESIEVQQLATQLSMTFAVAEKICEDVAAEKFFTITASERLPMRVVLTKLGRDYLIDLEKQHGHHG